MEPTKPQTLHLPAAEKLESAELVPALTVIFDQSPRPPSPYSTLEFQREFYQSYAATFCDALQAHAPQGFVDHILAELCKRKAALLVKA